MQARNLRFAVPYRAHLLTHTLTVSSPLDLPGRGVERAVGNGAFANSTVTVQIQGLCSSYAAGTFSSVASLNTSAASSIAGGHVTSGHGFLTAS